MASRGDACEVPDLSQVELSREGAEPCCDVCSASEEHKGRTSSTELWSSLTGLSQDCLGRRLPDAAPVLTLPYLTWVLVYNLQSKG